MYNFISGPDEWKIARLVLLPNGDKSVLDTRSYRLLCLLDVEGKLYEHLVQLKSEIEITGCLSEKQYGFKDDQQTLYALNEVVILTKEPNDIPRKKPSTYKTSPIVHRGC